MTSKISKGSSAVAIVAIVAALTLAAAGHTTAKGHVSGPRADRAVAPDYVPGEVVVQYSARLSRFATAGLVKRMGLRAAPPPTPLGSVVLRVPRGVSVPQEIARLRGQLGVSSAVPNYIAHAAGAWFPDDPGSSHRPKGWEAMQWNFLAGTGVNAPEAWANLLADHRPGGRGVVVAIVDTGVAYRDWHQYKESPDFRGIKFVHPYDFVANNRYPLDQDGHGTFVAGTIAEATNNGFGLTGLAYGASIMPVRVLDANADGDAFTISRGIRYAVTHGAQVINLSLQFDIGVTASEIPDIVEAIQFAHQHGVVVVAASGNDGEQKLAYPARALGVISVGATTRDRCLADYSNGGEGLDLVAPGGGDDAELTGDPNCDPARNLPDIAQMTFSNPAKPGRFGYPGNWYGTSMAAAHVAAAAALVIASRVIGRHPTPDQVLERLEQTADPLGGAKPNTSYGYGLLDAGAATAPAAMSSG